MLDINKLQELFKISRDIISDVTANWNTIHHQRSLIESVRSLYQEMGTLKKYIKDQDLSIAKQRDQMEASLVATWMAKTPAEKEARVAFRDESVDVDKMVAERESLREQVNMFKFDVRLGEIELQKFDLVGSSVADNG